MAGKRHKNLLKKAALVTLSAGVMAHADPGYAVKGNGTVHAALVSGIALLQQTVLNFGTFYQINPTVSGSVAVNTAGALVGEVNLTHTVASSHSNGVFKVVNATPASTLVITQTGAGTELIKNTAATTSMTVSAFAIGCGDFSGPTSATATAGVSCTVKAGQTTGNINIGAKLNVKANQPDGVYTGSYKLTVNVM